MFFLRPIKKMKLLLFTMLLAAPFAAKHIGGGGGCNPEVVPIPYPKFRHHDIYTPSFVPGYQPIDINVPRVNRCPSVFPFAPGYYGRPGPVFGRGGISSETNQNVIKGVISGSKVNMSNKGVGNVQSNSEKKGRGRRGGRGGGRGGGHKGRPSTGKGGKRSRRPFHPYYGYGGIKSENNVNKIEGHIYGSSINMSNKGVGNVQSNSKSVSKKGKKKHRKKNIGAIGDAY